MKKLAYLLFCATLLLAQDSALPFNEPLEQDGNTVVIQPDNDALKISIAPTNLQAWRLTVNARVTTTDGQRLDCRVSGSVHENSV